MIKYTRFQLDNGLRVIVHEDASTPMAAFSLLYHVGSKNESPQKTGFAHLFEHLMFGGTTTIPDFDTPIQMAGGENNAYTNADVTNFYCTLPASNLETIFWLEADRMANLRLNQKTLDVQRKVVVEEFKETCLNQPYGDVWHHLMDLTFKKHPYKWPTIGKEISHIEQAKLSDVKDFFDAYYMPNNAILVVAGGIKVEGIKRLAEKWFGKIPRGIPSKYSIPEEPEQMTIQKKTVVADVPLDALYMTFHVGSRIDEDYYIYDLLTDIMCNGDSARLYRKLKKELHIFSDIDAYITGSFHPGLLVIEGKPSKGVSLEKIEAAIWKELETLKDELIPAQELQKFKNKAESALVFSECNILNKAINLAYFELLGDVDIANKQVQYYQKITVKDIQRIARKTFRKENCSTLYYKSL